jgi:hypothetical protein
VALDLRCVISHSVAHKLGETTRLNTPVPGGVGAPPGTNRSPCWEPADEAKPEVDPDSVEKARPDAASHRNMARREAPAAIRKGRGRYQIALFGAPSPFMTRERNLGETFPAARDSSWPGLSRPSTSSWWHGSIVDARIKSGHDKKRGVEK